MPPQTNNSYYSSSKIYWPLNKIEEDSLAATTTHTSDTALFQHRDSTISIFPYKTGYRRSSSGFRCTFCRRRFHSIGNLANHQQLYQH
ncbi:hypothetical protein BCR42DRAFT_401350 [Absidia repens]|uniref:C2H2-type domain-containing protein n=1 Tax=Absidia repens TaxID=90262 RepID=A0A1X2J2F4_9FUNG|nr:hypothetical protein BCR42DRAFT_401350 [Absidia repens]